MFAVYDFSLSKLMTLKKQLVIGKKEKQKLNKFQQTFNRLVKKLEKLRQAKEKFTKVLSEKLDYYSKNIYPLEEEIAKLHKQSVKTFYRFYHEKLLTTSDKEILIELMDSQLAQFMKFSREGLDDELKKIYEFLAEEDYDESVESDFQAMKEDMSNTFNDLGIDIDLDDFTSDMSEEEMIRKMLEMAQNAQEQTEAKKASRKKTKKQLEKEDREKQIEEAKNKDISAIYKQLAKIFHPDLERDAERKAEKENMMKQLTQAYEKGDLHTLLRLELEWLKKEEDNLEKLSDEKLKIYNQALKEQVEELEMEIHFATEHPRYQPLQKYVKFFGLESINLKHEKTQLEHNIKYMKEDLAILEGDKPLKKLKEIIKETRKDLKSKQMFNFNLEDLFR